MDKKKACVLYVVRHGETEWNTQGRVQGHTDIDLSDKGQMQAQQRAEEFKEILFSKVISSDLNRAKQTAKILMGERRLPFEIEPVLREQSWGPWEGTEFDLLRKQFGTTYNAYTGQEPHSVPGVESHYQIARRVVPYLCSLAKENCDCSLLVVTHGGVLRSLIHDLPVPSLVGHHFENLGFIRLQCDGESLSFLDAIGAHQDK